jgi:DNA-binding PadR family transcriptional regulator
MSGAYAMGGTCWSPREMFGSLLMGGRGSWGPGGPPWGPGTWGDAKFGPGFGGGFGGPGPRRPRSRRGDVRLAIIALLAEEPMHGYQIVTELTERSDGMWRPSPGSVYPTLQQLEDEGLVVAEENSGRRVYKLTDEGRAEFARTPDGRRAPWEAMAGEARVGSKALGERAWQVAAAVAQVAATGNDGDVVRATEILTETRRALYRLLADTDGAE